MKYLSLLAVLLSTAAYAQNPVRQSGNITPGHAPVWTTTGVIADGGTSANGKFTSLGVTAIGPGYCQNTGSITGPFYQFCTGIAANGLVTISATGFGGAINPTLQFVINGSTYTFPFSIGGIVGPNSSVVGHVAAWNNTTGSLLQDPTSITLPDGSVWNTTGLISAVGGQPIIPSLPSIAALMAATIPASATTIQLTGYYVAGDSGAAAYTKISTPGSPQAWQKQSADGAWWQLSVPIVTQYQLGAKCDNATDDAAAFQAASDYAVTLKKEFRILNGGTCTLAAQVITTYPINISSDANTALRWTNASSSGWLLDFRAPTSNPGLTHISLPGLYSSAINSSLEYPGYPASWTGTARVGSAVTLWGGSRLNINVQYMIGWASGYDFAATNDVTYGQRAPQNITATVNTIDLCINGIYMDGGVAGVTNGLGPITVTANTVFSKFPILLNSLNNDIQEAYINITGQAFTNETGGAGIYDTGVRTNTSYFRINWLYAGFGADSPIGTSTTLTLPFFAGASASHGLTNDGNATVAYFGGGNNDFDIGLAAQLAAFPGGKFPVSGIVTRIRDVGLNNKVNVRYYPQQQTSAISLSTAQGESNFGGGVGAAGISKKILVSATVGSLAPGQFTPFYFYHTFLSAAAPKPVSVFPLGAGSLAISGLSYIASDNATNVNREGIVIIQNSTQNTIAGATYSFWLQVEE